MYAYAPENPLGQKLHTYGLSYLEILRQWSLGALMIVLVVGIVLQGNPMAVLGAAFLCLIGYFIHLIFLELNPKRIIVYEQGVVYKLGQQERSWRWEQITNMSGTRHTYRVNGIPVLRYGSNTFFAGPEAAFDVSHKTAEASRLVTLIFMKMAECQIPPYVTAYRAGKRLNFGNIFVDQTGILTQKHKISWPEMSSFRVQGNSFRIKLYGKSREINLGRVDPHTGYLLLGTLDGVLDTHSFSDFQKTHIRGPVRWLGVPRTLVLAVGMLIALFAILYSTANISAEYNASREQAARDDLVNRYGAMVNTLCAGAQEHPDGPPSSSAIHYVVVNADQAIIFADFQNALDKSQIASSKQDLTAIICLHATNAEVERCDYGKDGKADWHIRRYQAGYTISIVDAATGKTFATGAIGGSMPDECPDKAKPGDRSIYGSPPGADKLLKWLKDLDSPQGSTA